MPTPSATLRVIDTVINEWSGAFEGAPEAQMDALNWLADQRSLHIRKPNRMISKRLAAIARLPKERWMTATLELWKSEKK